MTARFAIIAGNSDLASGTAHPDCEAPNGQGFPMRTSDGYNLIGNTTGRGVVGDTIGNVTNQDAMLGPLLDDGGSTATHALQPGKPYPERRRARAVVAGARDGAPAPI